MTPERETVRLAAVGDIHCTSTSAGTLAAALRGGGGPGRRAAPGRRPHRLRPRRRRRASWRASWPAVKIPILAVLGNHDYESGKEEEVTKILTEAGVQMLDGDECRDPRHRLRGGEGLRRRLRPPHPRALGRGRHQGLRPRGGRRGAQARARRWPACVRRSGWRCCTTRRSRPPSRASRARSSRSSAPAAWRSRSTATR